MMANPGALYPLILKEFQWGILNKCQYNFASTRQVQFVQGPEKPWENVHFFKGLSNKVDELFLGDSAKEFRNKVNKTLANLADTYFSNVFESEVDIKQQREIKRKPHAWF